MEKNKDEKIQKYINNENFLINAKIMKINKNGKK